MFVLLGFLFVYLDEFVLVFQVFFSGLFAVLGLCLFVCVGFNR